MREYDPRSISVLVDDLFLFLLRDWFMRSYDLWILNAVCCCQVDVKLSDGTFARAAVPSGASTGK